MRKIIKKRTNTNNERVKKKRLRKIHTLTAVKRQYITLKKFFNRSSNGNNNIHTMCVVKSQNNLFTRHEKF